MNTKKLIPLFTAMLMILAACQPETRQEAEVTAKPEIAVLTGEGFHDGEAYMPMGYLMNRGAEVTVIGPEEELVTAYNSDFTIYIERAIQDVDVADFDALIIPGGQAPDALREHEDVVDFARDFYNSGKVVAAICHGPQVLITAGVMDGVTSTGFEGIKDELEEAGANYVDESVVIHENLITSRTPPDLYEFSAAIEEEVLVAPDIEDLPAQP